MRSKIGVKLCIRAKRAKRIAKREIAYFYLQLEKFNKEHKDWVDKNGHKI